ncbi:MAG: ParD-like family protein [Nocardioidaceae bacterium]|nr:ParD-like family protein [Nocardioidaceae bacterium]MCL2611742.1 ParD-like family protein [Nocardioidaceae bacterium]
MSTIPTRFDGGLFEAAKSSGAVNSRSAAQQLAHWARIGREFEAAPGVSHRAVEAVLAGDGSYDALAEREQALVRAAWDEGIGADIAALDLTAELGDAWVVGDAAGNAVVESAAGAATDPEA